MKAKVHFGLTHWNLLILWPDASKKYTPKKKNKKIKLNSNIYPNHKATINEDKRK